jgi:flavin-dependent dehydrogenase
MLTPVPQPNDADVLVIGAGPAGCAAARLLAQCGHRVLMIDRPPGVRHARAESIPPSATRILSALGMQDAVNAAGFQPWFGNTVWWGNAAPRAESFAPGMAGYQVERGRFDALLRDLAAHAGAQVIQGFVRDTTIGDQGVVATVESDDKTTRATASFVLDCSGRAGVIARRGLRVAEASHRTVALVGVWRTGALWPPEQQGHTLVASHADGWAWSVPTSLDTRYVTVMVDPERSHLTRGASALDVYRAELGKVTPFAPLLEGATLIEGPWGADASLYSTVRHAGPGFLLVGDAASSIDPLSSFGVKKALASGWLAAITVNTILTVPAMQAEATAFFEQRERAVVGSFRRQTARYAADADGETTHPFWQARVASTPMEAEIDGDTADDAGIDPVLLARGPDVLAVLNDLRRRQEIHLRRGAHARIAARSAIRGHLIVMDDHLFLPAWPGGVRYLRNIDLLLLLRLAPEHRDVGALYDALFNAQPGVSLPDFLGVLSTLVARGALEHEKTS